MCNTAIVNYHVQRAERQAFHFDVDGILGNLVCPELIPTHVSVHDLRGTEHTLNFARDGITFVSHDSQIKDFPDHSDWEASYNKELQDLLTKHTDAQEVIMFDHTVRTDDPGATRQPARNVHNDYNKHGAEERLKDILGEEQAQVFQNEHYGFVNVWRPIENTIQSSPLGFIRSTSMAAEDWMVIDLIYPDEVREILGVSANSRHEWFYLSEMTPNEVAIFNTYDNRGLPFLGHSALDMEDTGSVQVPRKSIESRAIIRYS